VHLTLRELLQGNDFLHAAAPAADYGDILASAFDLTRRIIRVVNESAGGMAAVFFLSIPEPSSTYRGILVNNRRESMYHCVRTLNDKMADFLSEIKGSYYLEINDLIRYYGEARISDVYEGGHFSHAGFVSSTEAAVLYSSIIERIRNSLTILKSEGQVKLIITDLDNTLWKGVLAELDEIVPHEHIEGWPMGYAESLLEFRRRGGLLAICSKNDHEQTADRLNRLWKKNNCQLLSIDDFCAVRINWNSKSENIEEILTETNILPSNALFVDDDPREIDAVTLDFPELRTLSGDQRAWRNVILYSPETQVVTVSKDSMSRSEMIKAKRSRDATAKSMVRSDYLRSLQMSVSFDVISNCSHQQYDRAHELLNKTNQFNTTGKKWGAAEFLALFQAGGYIVALSARDKFGDNGLVSIAVVFNREILQVVLSCRVFGFSIETALLCHVLEVLRTERDNEKIVAKFVDTGRNKTCASFYADNGFCESGECNGTWYLNSPPNWPDWIRRQ